MPIDSDECVLKSNFLLAAATTGIIGLKVITKQCFIVSSKASNATCKSQQVSLYNKNYVLNLDEVVNAKSLSLIRRRLILKYK